MDSMTSGPSGRWDWGRLGRDGKVDDSENVGSRFQHQHEHAHRSMLWGAQEDSAPEPHARSGEVGKELIHYRMARDTETTWRLLC